jgi:exodeoxyribonuclease V alpha subunit
MHKGPGGASSSSPGPGAGPSSADAATPEVDLQRVFVIIDEASMVSLTLLARLAQVLAQSGADYQLCFVGDDGQLRPIKRGEIFRMVLDRLPAECRVHLKTCYRTEHRDLYDACMAVRGGELPPNSEHFTFTPCDSDDGITAAVDEVIKEHGPDAQYLAWRNDDVVRISVAVQAELLKQGTIIQDKTRSFSQDTYVKKAGRSERMTVNYYVGDRVVFNGTKFNGVTRAALGTVVDVVESRGKAVGVRIKWNHMDVPVVHRYDEQSQTITTKEQAEEEDAKMSFMLSYCMTVHKSQGSEFPLVVVACYAMRGQRELDDRRWLYTAISRGSDSVRVVGRRHDVQVFVEAPLKPRRAMVIESELWRSQ